METCWAAWWTTTPWWTSSRQLGWLARHTCHSQSIEGSLFLFKDCKAPYLCSSSKGGLCVFRATFSFVPRMLSNPGPAEYLNHLSHGKSCPFSPQISHFQRWADRYFGPLRWSAAQRTIDMIADQRTSASGLPKLSFR